MKKKMLILFGPGDKDIFIENKAYDPSSLALCEDFYKLKPYHNWLLIKKNYKSIENFWDNYDYNLLIITNNLGVLPIICKIYGEFKHFKKEYTPCIKNLSNFWHLQNFIKTQ